MTTFQDHAARYERCAGPPSVPADGRRRFVAWRAAAGTALGNALNVLAHAYFVALWSRRELIVGPGLVPDLLCGRWGVITRCGLPRWTDGAVSLALNGTKDADPLHWIGHVSEADALQSFLHSFEGDEGNRDGKVTFEEWLRHHEELSVSRRAGY